MDQPGIPQQKVPMICKSCKEDLEEEAFSKCQRARGRQHACKKCNKIYRDKHKERVKDYQLQYKFGISLAEYITLSEQQKGLCAICSSVCRTGRKLAVDHDHKTGKIRGLLCVPCNQALGQFDEDINKMKQAIEYLKKYA